MSKMDPSEVEFLSEKQLVKILPNFKEGRIFLISFTQGVNVPHFIQVMKNALMTATLFMGKVLLESGHEYLLGDLGPFEPGVPTEIPLWMAVNLKRRKKCRIVPPEWMNVDNLEERKKNEKEQEYFTEMPCKSYLEFASLLLKSARDNIPHADKVQTLIKDIWEIRMAKLRKSINIMVEEKETHARLDNLTHIEINTIRPFLSSALDHMHFLRCHVAENPRTGIDYH